MASRQSGLLCALIVFNDVHMLSRCVYCTSAGPQAYVTWAFRLSRVNNCLPRVLPVSYA